MRFTRLGRAVVAGNVELVRKYLEEGDNVNELIDKPRRQPKEDDYGDYRFPGKNITPLIAACSQEWIDGEIENIPAIIDLLLDRGADVNHKTSIKVTPLILACMWEGTFVIDDAIKRMVDLGADVNAVVQKSAEERISPLGSLCWGLDPRNSTPESDRKRFECIRLLLDKGADPNGRVMDGMPTPLHYAVIRARQGSNAAMQAAVLLISRKANLTIRYGYGYDGKYPEDSAGPELWARIKQKLKDITAAKEFGKVRDIPQDVVQNIQEFIVGKKHIQESDTGKREGGRKTHARKTKRRKTLRRK